MQSQGEAAAAAATRTQSPPKTFATLSPWKPTVLENITSCRWTPSTGRRESCPFLFLWFFLSKERAHMPSSLMSLPGSSKTRRFDVCSSRFLHAVRWFSQFVRSHGT
ncbi:unnamed protein product [Ixodes pacificus]